MITAKICYEYDPFDAFLERRWGLLSVIYGDREPDGWKGVYAREIGSDIEESEEFSVFLEEEST